jgi:ubiquinone/menaquinone biosynthesis C-methylase UbiE
MANGDPAWIYETQLVPAIFEPWARVLIDLAHVKPGECVLDACCGTGVVARLIAPKAGPAGKAVGLDFDPGMIAMCQRLSSDVEWQVGDLQNLPFADATFDVVICQQGLQFLPNREAGLKQIYRVLRPAGRMALAVWTELANSPAHAILFEVMGATLGVDMSKPPAWSLPEERQLRTLVSSAGFSDVETSVNTLPAKFPSARRFVEIVIEGSSKITRQMLAQLPNERKTAFVDGVAARLRSARNAGGDHSNAMRLIADWSLHKSRPHWSTNRDRWCHALSKRHLFGLADRVCSRNCLPSVNS